MVLLRPRTPPMGWNSWDCYGTTVTEAEVLANAEILAGELLPQGWDTVVIDIDWSDPTARSHGYNGEAPLAMDDHGRLIPDVVRFPSSAGGAGFAPLAERIHALGLKFGIHTMRGIPRRAVAARTPILGADATAAVVADPRNLCEWNPDMLGLDHSHPAAQAYYDSTIDLYASWGVDFLKTDDMLWPYQTADIEAYSAAVERSPRGFALSLSPGRDLSMAHLDHLRAHATMWRVSDDLWDDWSAVVANLARLGRWAPHAIEGAWPDGDMLPLGRLGLRAERGAPRDDALTPAQRRTLLTVWLMARSPLMIGGDLPTTDPATMALFASPAVARIVSDSIGGREVLREEPLVLWTAEGRSGARYAAVINLGDEPLATAVDASAIGFDGGAPVRDLWTGATFDRAPVAVQSDDARGVAPGSTALRVVLEPHASALLMQEGD
ncbi:glycoside hydrolase family 27 protein [Microbacterium pumilum]|uniref:Alpha-galactosidase n=1 Tax=Microbacterium pumilum TaxID=344165 RepID=A0ABP5DHL3_9MICO